MQHEPVFDQEVELELLFNGATCIFDISKGPVSTSSRWDRLECNSYFFLTWHKLIGGMMLDLQMKI